MEVGLNGPVYAADVAKLDSRGARVVWTARMVSEAARQARFPYAPPTAVRRAQGRRIRATVAYARAHVPYYRETMRRLILGPEDFCTASDLSRLPLLEREQLQHDPEYFLSDQWPPEACVSLQSSGSMGASVTVFRDPPSFFSEAAYYRRLRSIITQLAGRRVRHRAAHIVPPGGSIASIVNAFRTRTQLPKNLQGELRTFSMLRPPGELARELEEYRPDVIISYGSYLEALFTHTRGQSARFTPPRVVVYHADPMSVAVRKWVETALGVEVLSSYGAVEATHIGFECERHRGYHLNVDLYPFRLIRGDGGEAAHGVPGEVVVSNLVNRGTVLLNYRLGDLATTLQAPCPCGRTLPLCSYLGRTKAGWLDLGSGQTIHAQFLRLALEREPEIWRYQIVQEAKRGFGLRLVPSPNCDRGGIAGRVLERFREQLGDGTAVRIDFVSDLPRGPSGKVQPVVTLSEFEQTSLAPPTSVRRHSASVVHRQA
jgi:phenylacetate-CoA ligase